MLVPALSPAFATAFTPALALTAAVLAAGFSDGPAARQSTRDAADDAHFPPGLTARRKPSICAQWVKEPQPVWEGFYLAADPCVVKVGPVYRMYFTGFLQEPDRAVIGMADSPDGVTDWQWTLPTDFENPVALALDGRPGQWDENLETVHVMHVGDELWMFYTGYVVDPDAFVSPYEIGLAKSTDDGLTWTRASDDPILPLDPDGWDNGAMTSPAVVEHEGVLHMIYLSWTFDEQGNLINFRISGATSDDPEGLEWTRHPDPVLQPPLEDLPWLDTATEPTLMKLNDGTFILFVTADIEDPRYAPVGIAAFRSDHPFGPWTPCPEPVIEMTQDWESEEMVAPHVMQEGSTLRMWYHGLTLDDPLTGERFRIGYAKSKPLPPLRPSVRP